MIAIRRRAGRVVLLDAAGRVLLVQERDGPSGARWLTPGGGIEAGESPARAASRELYEETGIVAPLPGAARPWHRDRYTWTIDGRLYDQSNDYFLLRLPGERPAVRPASLTEYEQSVVLGSRWWSLPDLLATADTVWPHELADLLGCELT